MRAMAANISEAGLGDHPRLVDKAETQSEIWHYFANIAKSQRYKSILLSSDQCHHRHFYQTHIHKPK